jgi:nucleotide sugar dehydrogenase
MRSIGIIGLGYVGKAMAKLFEKHYNVFGFDPNPTPEFPQDRLTNREGINKCDLAIICVPTQQNSDGSCDTTIVDATVDWLKTPLILIKSTVAIGSTEQLTKKTGKRIVFSPEYCGESSYWTPHSFHTEIVESPYFIFGGNPEDTSELVEWFLPVTGPTKRYLQTDSKTAELTKYMENTFFATKITFCYEFAQLCKAVGADYHKVRELWLEDPRINPMHTAVFEGNAKPFSGKCLPKDLAAIIDSALKAGFRPQLLEAVQDTNENLGKLRQITDTDSKKAS